MSAPFRELFVEVPAALLEILRAVVEVNIGAARSGPAYARPSPCSVLVTAVNCGAFGALMEHHGWVRIEAWRRAADPVIEVAGVRPCRYRHHTVIVSMTEMSINHAADPAYTFAVMLERAATKHACYCVERGPRWCDREFRVGDRVSWRGASHFGTRPVRWVGTVRALGAGAPFGEADADGEWQETGRHPAAWVEEDIPQHDRRERWPGVDPRIIVALHNLTHEET